MSKLLVAAITFFLSAFVYAGDWKSPIDTKYENQSPELFQSFIKAREIIDSWRGEGHKVQEANQILSSILEANQSFAPAYREYGRLYMIAGYINHDNFEEGSLNPSEAAILKSIELEPEYADAYVLLGHLYTNMKRYPDAEKALRKAEEIGTEIPWLHLNWADLLKKQRKFDQAMKRYQHIVDTGTSNRKAYLSALSGVTTMHRYFGENDKANEGFLKEIAYQPDDAWIYGNYSSFLLFSMKDVDAAITNGEKALSIMDYGMGRFILGCALYTKWATLKDNPATAQQAQQYFDKAWAIYPHPEKIIAKTRKYPHTKVTALALANR